MIAAIFPNSRFSLPHSQWKAEMMKKAKLGRSLNVGSRATKMIDVQVQQSAVSPREKTANLAESDSGLRRFPIWECINQRGSLQRRRHACRHPGLFSKHMLSMRVGKKGQWVLDIPRADSCYTPTSICSPCTFDHKTVYLSCNIAHYFASGDATVIARVYFLYIIAIGCLCCGGSELFALLRGPVLAS